jgi:hypothetical protein
MKDGKTFRILCLDGGGAKGVYTLGFLRELELAVKMPLCAFFDAIYGTSTGAIIAAMLGEGKSCQTVLDLYLKKVPTILKPWFSFNRSAALKKAADELFGDRKFDCFQTFVGIVATNWKEERPLIFKTTVAGAHGLKDSFVPGFGCRISDAVQASCSASPFFKGCKLDLGIAGKVELFDGGFSANNPSLFAISDALNAFKKAPGDIRLLSLGVGHYPEPERCYLGRQLRRFIIVQLLQKTLSVNANSTEWLVQLLCENIPHLRVSERFEAPELATDLMECDISKLERLIQKGRGSFEAKEKEVRELLSIL